MENPQEVVVKELRGNVRRIFSPHAAQWIYVKYMDIILPCLFRFSHRFSCSIVAFLLLKNGHEVVGRKRKKKCIFFLKFWVTPRSNFLEGKSYRGVCTPRQISTWRLPKESQSHFFLSRIPKSHSVGNCLQICKIGHWKSGGVTTWFLILQILRNRITSN